MRRRPLLALALASCVALGPWASAADPTPQVTDPAGDANFANNQGQPGVPAPNDNNNPTPAGSQDYADVLSVLWEKVGSDVRITATFKGAPAPLPGTSLVYRMLGTTPDCPFVGVVWYSTKSSDATIPKSAVRDNCTGETVLTEIAEPKIDGAKLIWTAPLSKFPAKALSAGTLTDLRVEIRELQDAAGYAFGQIEVAKGTGTFKIK